MFFFPSLSSSSSFYSSLLSWLSLRRCNLTREPHSLRKKERKRDFQKWPTTIERFLQSDFYFILFFGPADGHFAGRRKWMSRFLFFSPLASNGTIQRERERPSRAVSESLTLCLIIDDFRSIIGILSSRDEMDQLVFFAQRVRPLNNEWMMTSLPKWSFCCLNFLFLFGKRRKSFI